MTTTNHKLIEEIERWREQRNRLVRKVTDEDWDEHNRKAGVILIADSDTIVAALRAMDKLPRTADGVPIVPGMKLFEHGGDEKLYHWTSEKNDTVLLNDGMPHLCKYLYSTHTAALAALSHDNRQGARGGKP